jgi:hypothetical protein
MWLPGLLLLDLSGLSHRFDFGEQCAISTGISLAIIPVVMLWTTVLKIEWTEGKLLAGAVVLTALLVIRLFYKFLVRRKARNNVASDQSNQIKTVTIHELRNGFYKSSAIIAIFLFALIIRLVMIRDLATPAWVDSVHHALFTRLILVNGFFPSSYLPYLNISTTTYHLGFHSITATFTWLSHLSVDQALLILGQVLNAFIIFTAYLFTKNLTRSTTASLLAAVITGFLSPMPAYYTSWGRYTELTGLVILPVAFVFIRSSILEKDSIKRYWMIFLGGVASAGLFMVHYRVIVFFAGLITADIFIYILIKNNNQARSNLKGILHITAIAVISIVFVSPWLFPMLKNLNSTLINPSGINPVPLFQDFSWAYLTSARGKQILVMAGLGLLWGIIKQKRFVYLLVLWIVILFFSANLSALDLPGGGLISNSSVEIMLFIPISILGGYFIHQIIIHWKNLVPGRFHPILTGAILITIGGFSLYGARQLVTILNPITILTRNADITAMGWIRNNIPENETIVINPFAWGYGIYAGNDGGYWISSLTGRKTFPPPVLYGLGEGVDKINQKIDEIINSGNNPELLHKYMTTNHLQYIYIGSKGGVISPGMLSTSDLFSTVYKQHGVWIFSSKP